MAVSNVTQCNAFAFILERSDDIASTAERADNTCPGKGHPSIRLDINIWVSHDETADIDFGVTVPNRADISHLLVYIPYQITSQDFRDLQSLLQHNEIAHGIFDSDFKIETGTRFRTVYIHFCNEDLRSTFACLPIAPSESATDEPTIRPDTDGRGSIVEIDIRRARERIEERCDYLYFRFRMPYITWNDALAHIRDYREVISSPTIICDSTMLVGINESRQLPLSIRERLYNHVTVVEKVYIILVAEKSWSISSQLPPYRVRHLEEDIWNQYWLPASDNNTFFSNRKPEYLVYQWELPKLSNPEKGRSFLVGFSKKVISPRSIIFYLTVFFILNIISEFIVRCIFG